MKLITTVAIIIFVIITISFVVNNFNSQQGVIGAAKDIVVKYNLNQKLSNAKTATDIKTLLGESEKLQSPDVRIPFKLKLAQNANYLSKNKQTIQQVATSSSQKTSLGVNAQQNLPHKNSGKITANDNQESKKLKELADTIILNTLDDLRKNTLSKTAEEQDHLYKKFFEQISRDKTLEKQVLDTLSQSKDLSNSKLAELIFAQKTITLIQKQQYKEAEKYLPYISNSNLKLAITLGSQGKLIADEQALWVHKIDALLLEIKTLLKSGELNVAEKKIRELKLLIRELNLQ